MEVGVVSEYWVGVAVWNSIGVEVVGVRDYCTEYVTRFTPLRSITVHYNYKIVITSLLITRVWFS